MIEKSSPDPDRFPTISDSALNVAYGELRRVARRLLARERRGPTLDPTGLVHEACARLAGTDLGAAMEARDLVRLGVLTMRRILIDRARRRVSAERRLGRRVTVSGLGSKVQSVDLFELDAAVARLQSIDRDLATAVTLHYFFAMTVEETALALGISIPKAKKDLGFARAWLKQEIGGDEN